MLNKLAFCDNQKKITLWFGPKLIFGSIFFYSIQTWDDHVSCCFIRLSKHFRAKKIISMPGRVCQAKIHLPKIKRIFSWATSSDMLNTTQRFTALEYLMDVQKTSWLSYSKTLLCEIPYDHLKYEINLLNLVITLCD